MLRRGSPRFINASFEPGAGFMAVTYSRVVGDVGSLILIPGPGVFGAASPIAMAYVEGDPLVVFSTRPDPRRNEMHTLPSIHGQLAAMEYITKAQLTVSKPSELPKVAAKAFQVARSGKPGPVYVEIPLSMAGGEVGEDPSSYMPLPPFKPIPGEGEVARIMDALVKAERPVILAGRGIVVSGAVDRLIRLAETLDAPVCTTIMGKGAFPTNHPLYAGVAAGDMGNHVAKEVLENADVVLAIGVRFSDLGTGRYSMRVGGELIYVNVDPSDVGRVFRPSMAMVSDAGEFLRMLINMLEKGGVKRSRGSGQLLAKLWMRENEELARLKRPSGNMIEYWEVIDEVRRIANDDAIFVGDVGSHRIESFLMPISKPRTYITTTSWVSMGLAVPGSIAAKLAKPDGEVVGLVGDGGFLMTGTEVVTGVRYGAAPVIVVFNNSAYGSLYVYERAKYGTELTYRLPKVDIAGMARAMGAYAVGIGSRDELRRGLDEAFSMAKDRPVVVDVVVNPKVPPIPMRRRYGL